MRKESHPYLLISTTTGNRKFLLSSGDSWTIGRDSKNHCIIREKWISRNHALIEKTESEQFCLRDLSNSNGSYVNGMRINGSIILQHKDKIVFGQTQVEFHRPANDINNKVPLSFDHETLNSLFHKKFLVTAIIVELYEQELLNNELDDDVFSLIIDDWFSQTKFVFYQRGIVFNKSVGNSLIGIKFHRSKQPETKELFDLFQALVTIVNMTAKFADKYFLSFPLKIGVSLNTGNAMVKTHKTNHQVDYDIFGNCIDTCFYLKSAFRIIGKNLILGEKTYSFCSQLLSLTNIFKANNNPLQGIDKNQFIYRADLDTFVEFFQSNNSLHKVNNFFDEKGTDFQQNLPQSVYDYLLTNDKSFPDHKLKTIVHLDPDFELELHQKKQLFILLSSKRFMQKISKELDLNQIEFTQLVFEPLNYTNDRLSYGNNLRQEIEQELEIYYQLNDYFIIDIPDNLMGQAQIYNPSHLCAIYRKLS